MIRKLHPNEIKQILRVINDAACAYKGVIPEDRWKEPYMLEEELKEGIENGVEFYGWIEDDSPIAVMGIQHLHNVTLIRHAYVLPSHQRRNIGEKLLKQLLNLARTDKILVGTWKTAYWAVRFYQKNGFKLVTKEEKDCLLRKHWSIPQRQIETSVVLEYEREA